MGTEYTLLRDEFLQLPEKEINLEVKDVLITLGGSDLKNLSCKITKKIIEDHPNVTINVVVGPLFMDIIRELESLDNTGRIIVHTNAKMSCLMQNCDIAISACGSTLYELARCGVPIIGVVVADNQVLLAKKMDSIGVIKKARDVEAILGCITNMDYTERVKMSRNARCLLDGLGAKRLGDEIYKILKKQ